MSKLALYALGQLKKDSAWRGLVLCLTSAGVFISEELASQIVATGLAVAGLIGMLVPDSRKEVSSDDEKEAGETTDTR